MHARAALSSLLPALLAAALLCASPARSQIPPANAAGVAMGHLHYFVSDLDASRAFWVALGGAPGTFGAGELVTFPGFVVLLSEASADSEGGPGVADHVALRVRSLDAVEAAGVELQRLEQFPGIALALTPEGERVELFEEGTATNVSFDVAAGHADPVAERHNRPITAPVEAHHLHFYVPEDEIETARDWYVEHFGATPGTRWRYAAADLPGMNLNFSAADAARGGTQGRALDHIGFEVENLEAFCAALEDAGVALDQPYRELPSGFALAVLTDPWGTRIELTEGLREL